MSRQSSSSSSSATCPMCRVGIDKVFNAWIRGNLSLVECPICYISTSVIDGCDSVVCNWCHTEFNVVGSGPTIENDNDGNAIQGGEEEEEEDDEFFETWLQENDAVQCPDCHIWTTKIDGCEFVVCAWCDTEFNFYTGQHETDDRDEDGSWASYYSVETEYWDDVFIEHLMYIKFEDWDDDFIERLMYIEFMDLAMDEEWEFERELHPFMDGVRYSYCGRKMLWNNVNRLRKQERSKKKKNGATAARRGHHDDSRCTPSKRQDRKKDKNAAKTQKMMARRKNQKQQAAAKY